MIGAVCFVFFVSGMSGLMYQVLWVREFGQIFGNTVQSAALITGVFMAGLGAGSYLAGNFIDRRTQRDTSAGLRYYAYSELLIGLLGFSVSLIVPRIESLSPWISDYRLNHLGWYALSTSSHFFQYVVAGLLLGPIAALMGATLTFLIRFVLSRSVESAGWKIGLLYGTNTLGAAVGCGMVDLWAVPALGLMRTKMVAVALNLLAAIGALVLLKAVRGIASAEPSIPDRAGSPEIVHGRSRFRRKAKGNGLAGHDRSLPSMDLPVSRLRRAGLALAISGFSAMGMEIVWFRCLTGVYSNSRFVYSLVLVTILVGMWLGSLLAGFLSRRCGKPEILFVCSQLLFSFSAISCLLCYLESDRRYLIDQFRDVFFGTQAAPPGSLAFGVFKFAVILGPTASALLIPAVFMGFAFPLMNAVSQKATGTVGSSAGSLYLVNTVGAFLGSLAVGFGLLPRIGMQNSVTVLALAGACATAPVLRLCLGEPARLRGWRPTWPAIPVLALLLAVLAFWHSRSDDYFVRNSFFNDWTTRPNMKWLKVSEGINEFAVVTEWKPGTGVSGPTWRQLYTNGHPMAGADYLCLRYMRSFVHIPLLQMERPGSVLVICFGVGNTAQAAALYPSVSNLEVADLSENVLRLAPYFREWNRDVLKDPRTRVFINDGRQHLRMQPEGKYDLVTLEPPPIAHAGVASLYTEEFYRLGHRALKPGGYFSQWLPMFQVAEDHNRRLIKAFLRVFPNAVLLNGAHRHFILLGQKEGPNQIDWRAFRRRLAENPGVRSDLADIDLAHPVEALGMFVAGPQSLSAALANVRPMTDDDPVIETNHFLDSKVAPAEVFRPARLVEWCPSCFADGNLAEELRPLSLYLSVLQGIYADPQFFRDGPFPPERRAYKVFFSRTDRLGAAPDSDRLLQWPTQEQFSWMLRTFPYLQTAFGPDWDFEFQK